MPKDFKSNGKSLSMSIKKVAPQPHLVTTNYQGASEEIMVPLLENQGFQAKEDRPHSKMPNTSPKKAF